jgi:hypothetical protein
MDHRYTVRPLLSRPALIGGVLLAALTVLWVLSRGYWVATIHVDRETPPIEREEPLWRTLGGRPKLSHHVRVYGSYQGGYRSLLGGERTSGTLYASYRHARAERGAAAECRLVLFDRRHDAPTPSVFALVVRGQLVPEPVPDTVSLTIARCDERALSELGRLAAHLDGWLADGDGRSFEEAVGYRWRNLDLAALTLFAFVLLLGALARFRWEVHERDGYLRSVRGLGRAVRLVAQVPLADIEKIAIATKQFGPLVAYRPVAVLRGGRTVGLWPGHRWRVTHAVDARTRITELIDDAAKRKASTTPFRD